MEYRLLVSPSPFRPMHDDERRFGWYLMAWFAALIIVIRNPFGSRKVMKR